MITQQQYNVSLQRTRELTIKLELMNTKNAVLESLEGKAVSGSINIDAESTYRRSGSISITNVNGDYIPKAKSKIWFNRRVRISIGLKSWNDEIIWFDQGVFNIVQATVTNNLEGVNIDIDLSDLMSNIDGTLNGSLSHEVNIKPEGIPLEIAIRQTLEQVGNVGIISIDSDDFKLNGIPLEIPYELNFSPDSSVYDAVKSMLDLYMGYEMFYDERGILIVRKVRNRENDPIIWDFSKTGMDLAIDYQNTYDFANVRNSIFLWGRKKDTGETIKWIYRNRFIRKSVSEMNSITSKEIGDICTVKDNRISYVWDGSSWKDSGFKVNPDFSIEMIGEKKTAFTDEKIATVEQAKLRAEYELKKRNNLVESISSSVVPIYALEPNSKVYIEDSKSGIKSDYIVKSVSIGMSPDDNMSIQAEKLYY